MALVIGLPAKHVYEDAPTMLDMLGPVGFLGFEACDFFPISRDRDGLRAIEFDGVFVRPEAE